MLAYAVLSLGCLFSLFGIVLAEPKPLPDRRACENEKDSRACWGSYSIDTDYYEEWPDTGVVKEVRHWTAHLSICGS